jgi:hypothetical protein
MRRDEVTSKSLYFPIQIFFLHKALNKGPKLKKHLNSLGIEGLCMYN